MKEIVFYFTRLGLTGFGGPLALIAQMQKELVEERKWMAADDFRQALGLIKSMPGPAASQVAVFLGRQRYGFCGGFAAGVCLILPAFFLIILLAEFYDRLIQILWIQSALLGMQIAACALILLAMRTLSLSYLKLKIFWVMGAFAFILLHWFRISEPLVIIGLGAIYALSIHLKSKTAKMGFFLFSLPLVTAVSNLESRSVLQELFWVCLKAGALVFGTGLAIIPFLEGDFVDRLNWLTHSQFLDAVALGQLTPGPVIITVTFIGYKLAGWSGAIVATVAVFGPAFFHMLTWFPKLVSWMKRQTWISNFTLAVTAAVVASILHAEISIVRDYNWVKLAAVLIGAWVSLRFKMPSWATILGGAVLGSLFL